MKNLCRAELVRTALLRRENKATLTNEGVLVVNTSPHTGRSPNGKFIVEDEVTRELVDWDNNQKISEEDYQKFKDSSSYGLNFKKLFIQDVYAGGDPSHKLKIRIHTDKAWHSLFARNMFFIPSEEEQSNFEPDFNLHFLPDGSIIPKIVISFKEKEIIITGTSYAGEMKKSVFTVLNFLLPQKGILPMHCSVNVSLTDHKPTIFFGLSGTGKTTLSSDTQSWLVGDDEHGWSDEGLFNFEGGCYAKTIDLSKDDEPIIYNACHKFGTILENVNLKKGKVDFSDAAITQNTRASYPLGFIHNTWKLPTSDHPANIIMLTCDASGILPPVANLDTAKAIGQFLLGYTAKIPGTEKGVEEPEPTFSHCFGAPFMPLKPQVYARLLKQKIEKYNVTCWLVNTGWTGGPYGTGKRMPISLTRKIVRAIQEGWMKDFTFEKHIYTDLLEIPTNCKWIPEEILRPELGWKNKEKYVEEANKLMSLFVNRLKIISSS